jgi:hypothetical protein
MAGSNRKEELERRLEQSRRLIKDAYDPTTKERIGHLIDDLENEEKLQKQK